MKSRVQKKEMRWEKLDNTANLFPVIANETMTNVYRIAVILSENIRPECLQEALEQVLPWFNTMNVRMRTGMFWYYFETNTKGKPVVREEQDFPCRYVERHENRNYLFRVTYYKNRINLEVFHALADGMGAVNFLRELTYQYLRIYYPQLSGEMGDRLCDDTSLDTEDSYLKNYKKAGKKTYKSVPAVHMKGEHLVRGELGTIHGYMSVKQLKEKAKELGTQYSNMDAASAAKILTEMSEDLDLVCDILENMKESQAAQILQNMDSDYAAQITKKIAAVKDK